MTVGQSGASLERILATKAKLDKGRASLETAMVKRLSQPSGTGTVTAWLLVIDPGHLRVLSEQEVGAIVDLGAFHDADALAIETREHRERIGALRLRLIRTEVEVEKRRLKIPSDAFDACEEYLDRAFVWLEQTTNRCDVYTATYRQRAMSLPVSRFSPDTE